MTSHLKLPWGEKHLCGMYYTVKLSVSKRLYEAFNGKLRGFKDLNVFTTYKKGTHVEKGFILYGVLHYDDYMRFLSIKQNAQAQILIEKAADLLNQVKDRDSNEKETSPALAEDGGLSF